MAAEACALVQAVPLRAPLLTPGSCHCLFPGHAAATTLAQGMPRYLPFGCVANEDNHAG